MCWVIKKQDKAISESVATQRVLWQVACVQRVAVVSRITNSCVEQAVIVIIIVVSVKCEQWHTSSENNNNKNKEFNWNKTYICSYLVCK